MPHEGPNPAPAPEKSPDVEGKAAPRKKQKVVIAEVENIIRQQAREIADSRMTASPEELRGISGLRKKIWNYNLAREYYRQKEVGKAEKEILAKGNVYAGETEDESVQQKAFAATVERFSSEYDETIHREAGEKAEKLGEGEKDKATEAQIKELIHGYVKGELNDENFAEERNRLLSQLSGVPRNEVNKKVIYADNLFEIAKQVKQSVKEAEALGELDLDFEVIVGKAKLGVRTEAQYNAVDRIVDKIERSKIGRFASETTIASAVAIAFSLGAAFSKRLASSRLMAWGSFGATAALGAGAAGLREAKKLKDEFRQHSREMAKGKKFDSDRAPRRKIMEELRYETADVEGLTDLLEQQIYKKDESGKLELKNISQSEFQAAVGHLAEIEARIQMSDRQKIDLLRYTSAEKVEEERLRLDISRARAKVDLKRFLQGKPVVDFIPNGQNFDQFIASLTGARAEQLTGGDKGIEQKNRLFSKMRNKEVAKAVAKGLATGLVVGGIVQEAGAFFRSDQEGLLKGLFKGHEKVVSGAAHFTPLEYLRRWWSGDFPRIGPHHQETFGDAKMRLPEGFSIKGNPDGSFNLLRGGEAVGERIILDAKGNLSDEVKKILGEKGVFAASSVEQITVPGQGQITTTEFIQQRLASTKQIRRVLWYDNDTPKPVFDKNELKLWWGGQDGTGIDNQGNFVYDIRRMTPDGSYHGKFSADAQQLMKAGKLKVLFSLSRDTQNQVFEVPVNAQGQAIINPNSEAGKVFFQNAGGKAKFLGKFAEVAEVAAVKDNVEQVRILATDIGPGAEAGAFVEKLIGPSPQTKDVPRVFFDALADHQVELPPVIPVFGRRPLEPTREKIPSPVYPYYGAGSAEAVLENFKKRGIELDPYQVIKEKGGKRELRDKDGGKIERSLAREKQRIESYLADLDPNYRKELEALAMKIDPMDSRCRICVNIPARFEARNIANLLDQYSGQRKYDKKGRPEPLDPSLFEINIIVNRKKSEASDNSLAVIEQWKQSNPGVKVNAVDVAFDDNKACVGLARKYITDLTLLRAISRQRAAGPLYIESEDADLFSVDRRTIWKLIRDFDEHPEVDVLRGVQDRQPEVLQKNDLLFVERRLWDFMEMFLRNSKYRPSPENPKASFIWHCVCSGGWNTAYTAEVYTQIGGYNPTMIIGEDMDIGQKIAVLRGSRSRRGDYIPNTWTSRTSGIRMSSSPRRFIDAMARKITPYDDFENQAIKTQTLDEMLDKISEYSKANVSHISRYQEALNAAAGFLKGLYPAGSKEWQAVLRRSLTAVGLKKDQYTLTDNGVTLKQEGMKEIINRLKRYKESERWKLGYRRQNSPLLFV